MAALASLLLTTVLWTQSAPASAPETGADAEIATLIRDLNHPQPARRKAAAVRLTELGDVAEKVLEKAQSNQPAERIAEAKATLKKAGLDWDALLPPASEPAK